MTQAPPTREPSSAELAIAQRREAALAEPLGNSGLLALESITKIGDIDRLQVKVMLHPVHQYEIAGKREKIKVFDAEKNREVERWVTHKSVQPTSDGYDYLNRWMGVQLVQPEFVPDELGNMVPNPIHHGDYVYLRLMGIYYNDLGQLRTYKEDIEVDFYRVYMDARLNATWYEGSGDDRKQRTASEFFKLHRDETGMPVIDDKGNPVYDLTLPEAQELKAIQTWSQLRRFGIRYAFTVAKTRILKTASGIRRLPVSEKKPVSLSIVGFADRLTPDERIAKAQQTAQNVWGAQISHDGALSLTDAEMDVATDEITRDPDAAEFSGPTEEEKAEILAREAAEAEQQ